MTYVKLTFDGCLEALGDGDHHVGSKHPENVVEEEAAQQDAAGDDVVKVQQFHSVDSERQTEEVVGHPVFAYEVPGAHQRAAGQRDHVVGGEAIVDQKLGGVAFALLERDVIRNVLDRGGYQIAHDWTGNINLIYSGYLY